MESTQPKATMLRASDLPSVARVGGASTTRLVSRACGAQAILNGFTSIPPGVTIPVHYHNCEESVLVIEGEAVAEIDGEATQLQAGDVTWIPAELPHRFRNPSPDTTLRIFWTYATADATRTLVESGETHTIDAEHSDNS